MLFGRSGQRQISKMKFLVLVAACVSVASASLVLKKRAVPGYSGNEAEAPIVKSESAVSVDGFNYAYETGNGIKGEASGVLKKVGNEGEAVVVQGQYSYTGPDNEPISVQYIADEDGFHPQGAHLPTSPPIPEDIQRGIQYVLAHPPPLE